MTHQNEAVLDEDDLSKLWYSEEDCRRYDFRNRLLVDMVKMGGHLPASDEECFRGLESFFHHAIQDTVVKSQEAVFNAQRKNESILDAYTPFSKVSIQDARRLGERDAEQACRLDDDTRKSQRTHQSLSELCNKPSDAKSQTKIKKFFNLFRRKKKNKIRVVHVAE